MSGNNNLSFDLRKEQLPKICEEDHIYNNKLRKSEMDKRHIAFSNIIKETGGSGLNASLFNKNKLN